VLLFSPHARFAELQKASELTSDHFNFYLKQLLDEEYITKNKAGAYHLTVVGGKNPRGELIEQFEGGRNAWMTQEDYSAQEKTFEGTKDSFQKLDTMPHIPIAEAHYDYAPEHY
jgi:hypothetical protein